MTEWAAKWCKTYVNKDALKKEKPTKLLSEVKTANNEETLDNNIPLTKRKFNEFVNTATYNKYNWNPSTDSKGKIPGKTMTHRRIHW